MTEWKTYRLGNVCKKVCSGGTPKSTEPSYYDGDIPWLNTKEINFNRIYSTERCITQKGLDNSSTKWIDANCVIVAMYGATAAKVAINKIPLTTNQACCNLSIDEKIADYHYVYYWLCANYTELASLANGGAQQNLNAQQIKDFEISLPSLEEQRRIAGILSAIDDKIENNRRINTNLELQAQALYKQWFVDFEFPNEEGKPYKSSGGKMVDSELGQIPEGWRVQTISDISVRIASGGTPKSLNESYYNGEIKWFTTKELKDCFLIDSDKHISTEALNDSAAKLFPKNTILMAIYAAPTVGRLGILTAESTFNQAAVGIVAKEEIGHLFVYLTLLAERENLNNLASGAAQQNLNVGIVKQYKLIVPTKKLLIEFNQIAGSLFERIKVVSNENKILATLRDTLVPKLMNGEIITK